MIRRYRELRHYDTFEERYRYLRLQGSVGRDSFGFDRYVNQKFYKSREWRRVRDHVISRDEGCDLGIEGYEIHTDLLVHHMNPMELEHILEKSDKILDPQFLVTTTHRTHNAIHYGDESQLMLPTEPRTSGDTKLW